LEVVAICEFGTQRGKEECPFGTVGFSDRFAGFSVFFAYPLISTVYFSFMKYDDFFGSALPKMTERTKINLRTLDLQVFAYGGEYPSPLLYLKSRHFNEELPHYAEQVEFDESLTGLEIVDLSGYAELRTAGAVGYEGICW
jgi:ABC-type sugar transport system permease subunit